MNKEDYVSIEVAKLLKERGYDEDCGYAIGVGPRYGLKYLSHRTNSSLPNNICSRPSLHEAQKWLRTKKGIYVWLEPVIGHKWTVSFCDFNVSMEESDWIGRKLNKDGYPIYETYEEALNTGILEVLKLI